MGTYTALVFLFTLLVAFATYRGLQERKRRLAHRRRRLENLRSVLGG